MDLALNVDDKWVDRVLSHFNEEKQEDMVMKMMGSENEFRDALAELQSVRRLNDLGFTILDGNRKEGVFKAQFQNDDPFWVVSCSLSRFFSASEIESTDVFRSLSRGREHNSAHSLTQNTFSIDVHIISERVFTPILLETHKNTENEASDLLYQLKNAANGYETGEVFMVSYHEYDLVCTVTKPDSEHRFITAITHDSLEQTFEFGKKRAIKHCLKKIPDHSSSVLICMNAHPEPFAESLECLGVDLFRNISKHDFVDNKKSKRVFGVLLSSGNPFNASSLIWSFKTA